MLRLKQIDLHGFKSFCNRERLRFSGRGIAAVVGPNGCGKSNICDAVNWVLGEQSPKSLRGSRMHDVIFSGTRNRAPSGLATITLTLQDSSGALQDLRDRAARTGPSRLPAASASGEISVTRKLFRNGKSHYMLNGKVVRLRDVRDLFLGTGLGPNHYAIIEQGRIGQLLTARSSDRRAFIDEAAGVTRFKARRKLAELKLANAGLNLERVHDILQEVRRQARSLQRQAERAERYERYRKEFRAALGLLLANRFRHADSERKRLESDVEAAAAELGAASAAAGRMDREFSEKRAREEELEAQLESDRENLSTLRVDEERMRERVEQQATAVSANGGRINRAERTLESIAARAERLGERVSEERSGIAALDSELEDMRQRLAAREAERAGHEAAMAEHRSAEKACRKDLLDALSRISAAKAVIERLGEALIGHERRLGRLREQTATAQEGLAEATSRREQLVGQASDLRERVGLEVARCRDLKRAVDKRRRSLGELRRAAQDARSEASGLAARRDSLREMLEHRAYTTEAVKDILEALGRDAVSGLRPLGILADFLEVEPGYEKAVEQFLGEDLEHVVVADWEQARRGVRLVREEIGARVAFFVRPGPATAEEEPAEPIEGAAPLSEHVRLAPGEGGWRAASLPKLRDGYLVADAATAVRLAPRHPSRYFLLPDGTWYRASTVQAGRKASSGPLVLKQQLRELLPQIEDAERALESRERKTEASEALLREDSENLDAARGSRQKLEKELVATEHDLRQAIRQSKDLARTIEAWDAERGRIEGQLSEASTSRDTRIAARRGFEADYERQEALLAKLAYSARTGQAALVSSQEACAALRAEVAALDERHSARVDSLRRTEGQEREQHQRLDDSRRRIARWREENARLEASNSDLAGRIEEAKARRFELRASVDAAAGRLRDLRRRLTALIGEIRDKRVVVEEARRRRSALDVRLARVEADLEHVAETCAAELGEPIAQIADDALGEPSAEALRDAEERHRRIRERIDRLGPVNVLAREEFERVSERRDFLETQQQDLLDAIRDTRGAIEEIEVATRESFQAAFAAINREFRQVFATLFDGGVGEMRLSEPDNMGESGIDIVAQPPGKRLQNVALLSGGEKSLTVMALLMATFRYKPSPFCILDEVDSQLDEANTVRLRRLLQEMAPETQFIVITHSTATMEVAETLYGVTMGEAGVSKMVSVRMHDAVSAERPAEPLDRVAAPAVAVGA